MDLRILGPLEAYDDEGRPVELGGRQQRLVLAALLLHRNEVVSVDRLVDVIWGERAPANASRNVQVHVSRLRKAFENLTGVGAGGRRIDFIRTRANGYVLEVGRDELDVDRFERLVEESRQGASAGELEYARSTLEEALALWRGRALADFTYDSFAQSEIARLEELRLGALEDRIDVELALGLQHDAVPAAQALVAEHPLRERPRGQLMLALYRAGRKAEALRVYDEARRALVEELGFEPGERLQALQRAVLTDDPSLSGPPGARMSRPGVQIRRTLVRRRDALLALGGALVLGAALTISIFEVTRDRTSAGLASLAPNVLAAIDPSTNRLVSEIPVGARPASVAEADGSLWVANLDDETVQRIDPKESRVVRTIPAGAAVTGMTSGRNGLWAIAGERGVVFRIDPTFNQVVDRIGTVKVGTLLTAAPATGAIAATGRGIWAVSGGFFAAPRLFHIDPVSKRVIAAVSIGNGPTALAAGFGDLWIADGFENTVSRVDPSGVVLATIPVGPGANAVAVGEGAVWVVDSLDDAVAKIDPKTNSVITNISVGRYPTSAVVGAGAVWVANAHDGTVSRIDADRNAVVKTIDVGSAPAGLVISGGSVWVTSQERTPTPVSDATTESGTARFTAAQPLETDPARYPERQINYATCAKLLNYPDATGPAGIRLVPEVAASMPSLSADGRTYTFTIRNGFAFSPPLHETVTAATFKYAIERSLSPKMGVAAAYIHDIAGEAAYEAGKARHISGVVVEGKKLAITLTAPAADLPARIAMSFFCAVPQHTPIDQKGVQAIPSAGPYYIADYEANRRIVLERNPDYHGTRPARLRRIEYTLGVDPAKGVADVESGRSDYLVDGVLPDDRALDARLLARYGPASAAARSGRQRYFLSPTLSLAFLALNTSRPLFSDLRWRSAVNYAIDRRALARAGNLITGPFPAIPTDRYLPPAIAGSGGPALFPPGGDKRKARRIAPDRGGAAVLYTCNLALCRRQAQVIRTDLAAIGLDVEVREFPIDELFGRVGTKGEPFDIVTAHWGADYADPSDFLNVLLDQHIGRQGNLNLSYYTTPSLARRLGRVARVTGDARDRAYAALADDVAHTDAPWVPYATGTSRDFFSGRMGCQLFQPVYGIDLGALCLRSERG